MSEYTNSISGLDEYDPEQHAILIAIQPAANDEELPTLSINQVNPNLPLLSDLSLLQMLNYATKILLDHIQENIESETAEALGISQG